MTADMIAWARATLDTIETATIRNRDGHEGPCVNYDDQDPADYNEYDSCSRHIAAAEATPYRDVEFGLADIAAKRRILDRIVPGIDYMDGWVEIGSDDDISSGDLVRLLAVPFAAWPGYREEWRPVEKRLRRPTNPDPPGAPTHRTEGAAA